ncbi:MAG: hypothetical protein IJ419_09760 [Agathobacter sp.]|nr:hypothetical protein [Agathobacter sp.]
MKRFIINLVKWYGIALVASVVLGAVAGFFSSDIAHAISANVMSVVPLAGAIYSTVSDKRAAKKAKEEADDKQLAPR